MGEAVARTAVVFIAFVGGGMLAAGALHLVRYIVRGYYRGFR